MVRVLCFTHSVIAISSGTDVGLHTHFVYKSRSSADDINSGVVVLVDAVLRWSWRL